MSILISLPCYGGLVSEKTSTSLFNLGKLLVRNNIDHGIMTVANESMISKGRSRIANFFMNNTEFEYLFCLDADVAFQAEDVLKLYSYQNQVAPNKNNKPYDAKTSTTTPVWDTKNPKSKSKKLTPAQKAEAKSRAKKAGRPYPNLVDNMAAAREKKKK